MTILRTPQVAGDDRSTPALRLRRLVAAVSATSLVATAVCPAVCAPRAPQKRAERDFTHVTVGKTFARSGPSLEDSEVALLDKDAPVRVDKRSGDWAYVYTETGGEGWIHTNLLALLVLHRERFVRAVHARGSSKAAEPVPGNVSKPEKKAVPEAMAAADVSVVAGLPPERQRFTRGDGVVRSALSFRGTPYRMGASGRGAFDCSGFTSYLFRKAGSPLPRTAAQQFTKGVPIGKDHLRPGDLVFFKNTYKRGVSHVGVYVGDGLFVHASSAGGGVVVDRLRKPYYLNHWAGARRPR